MEKIIIIYLAMAANEAHFCDCCHNMGHFLCGEERVKCCEHPFALHLWQPKKGKEKADVVTPGKNYLDAHCIH